MSLANSLMLDFRCLIVPRFVYATGKSFADDRLADDEVRQRIGELGAELERLSAAVAQVAESTIARPK